MPGLVIPILIAAYLWVILVLGVLSRTRRTGSSWPAAIAWTVLAALLYPAVCALGDSFAHRWAEDLGKDDNAVTTIRGTYDALIFFFAWWCCIYETRGRWPTKSEREAKTDRRPMRAL
jgi:hypothetical protein